ncbi:acid protease [Babesia caballi]|uniref:Acid protease n=1 Tax=Babesia caballi TaxID=5871 RepID=A0AAV4LR52_BABCB|nr:acid protease [Babesia caballi]
MAPRYGQTLKNGPLMRAMLVFGALMATFAFAAAAKGDVPTLCFAFVSAALPGAVYVQPTQCMVLTNCLVQLLVAAGLTYSHFSTLQRHLWRTVVDWNPLGCAVITVSFVSFLCSVALLVCRSPLGPPEDDGLFTGISSAFVTFDEYNLKNDAGDEEPLFSTRGDVGILISDDIVSRDEALGYIRPTPRRPPASYPPPNNSYRWDWVPPDGDIVAGFTDSSPRRASLEAATVSYGSGNAKSSSPSNEAQRFPSRPPSATRDSPTSAMDRVGLDDMHLELLSPLPQEDADPGNFWADHQGLSGDAPAVDTAVQDEGLFKYGEASLAEPSGLSQPLRDSVGSEGSTNSAIFWGSSSESLTTSVALVTATGTPIRHIIASPTPHLPASAGYDLEQQDAGPVTEEAHTPVAGLRAMPVARADSKLVLNRRELVISSTDSFIWQASSDASVDGDRRPPEDPSGQPGNNVPAIPASSAVASALRHVDATAGASATPKSSPWHDAGTDADGRPPLASPSRTPSRQAPGDGVN